MSNPTFSVITPVLNRKSEIQQMMVSILGQTFNSFELIIVDNGSTDGTLEVCKEFEKQHAFISLRQAVTKGLAFARNEGIKHANGKYCVLLDSDNQFFDTNVLNNIHEIITECEPNAIFTYSFDDQGTLISHSNVENSFISFEQYVKHVKGELPPIIRTEWFKQNLYPEIQGIISELPYLVWFKLVRDTRVYVASLVTQVYGTHSENRICGSKTNDVQAHAMATYYYRICKEYKEDLIKSAPKEYFKFLAKFSLYNRVSKAYAFKECFDVAGYFPFMVLRVLPKRLIVRVIDFFKRLK